jgi:hypothetical protein
VAARLEVLPAASAPAQNAAPKNIASETTAARDKNPRDKNLREKNPRAPDNSPDKKYSPRKPRRKVFIYRFASARG